MHSHHVDTHSKVILDSIADGVFTVDKEWTITSFNRAAEQICGLSRTEAIGRKCWEVFHADVCEQGCLLKKTFKTRKPCVNKIVSIVNAQGVNVPISVSTALLQDEQGTIIGGVESFRDISEVQELRKELWGRFRVEDIVTRDATLLSRLGALHTIAQSEATVLVLGESGTGKELLARALHNHSTRCKGPFVAVNCGALPETLMEAELFGYKKGAFTDAKGDKPGRFERARGGTLFLDEVGELTKTVQVKLLRVLQERRYEPLGGTSTIDADVRIVAATNRDLEQMVAQGNFREDLYYRINVMTMQLPPLRERRDDIPLLLEHFIAHFNTLYAKNIERVDADALASLMAYSFPGNIRELENMLHHAFVLCTGGVLGRQHFPERLFSQPQVMMAAPSPGAPSLEQFEKQTIEQALVQCRFSRVQAARLLGMHPSTLWRKMKRLGIDG
jgi:PAS domain S-box-containing protein